jgi:hypothetical protein
MPVDAEVPEVTLAMTSLTPVDLPVRNNLASRCPDGDDPELSLKVIDSTSGPFVSGVVWTATGHTSVTDLVFLPLNPIALLSIAL